ncbi:MAG: virulence-associated family protein [Bacteroidetes bacterium]|jgi:predicted P-loop ATPase|nr:virulence-associated family protein [Bacteroidota bacterium]
MRASHLLDKNNSDSTEMKNTDVQTNDASTPQFVRVENYINNLFDLRYNIVSNTVEYKEKDEKQFRELNENNIYCLLQRSNINFSMTKLLALLKSDFVPKYNPFIEYFENLPHWNDGEPDYISMLTDYFELKNPNEKTRFKNHLTKALVRSVACSLMDGVFNKQCLVLVSERQNSGKSTFCRWLCPPQLEYYYSEHFNLDKDSLIALSQNFIINLDELATLSKFEINYLKSMFSKDFVKVRHPFEKKPIREPRRCNFFGSTNKTEFLSDETGSVRWLCFEILSIDWEYSKVIDINKIWAQAYSLFKNKFKYELTSTEIAENETVNQSFQITTAEMDLIQKYYQPGTKDDSTFYWTTTEILCHLNRLHPEIRLTPINLGKALKLLGFERQSRRLEGKDHPTKVYCIKNIA